jgi:quercetin dioxygenase-like cupin family protein
MHRILLASAIVVLSAGCSAAAPASNVAETSVGKSGPVPLADQLSSVQLVPDQLEWRANPVGGDQAFIIGDPSHPGLYVVRYRLPAGMRLPPHFHPDARVATVLSGTMYFSYGQLFDSATLRAYPEGSVWTELPGQAHFAWVRDGPVILQISGTGPSRSTPVPQK